MPPSRKGPALILPAALLLAALVLAVYLPAVPGVFFLDDGPNIVENRAVHVENLSPEALWGAMTRSPARNRPLTNLSFALTYRMAGLRPWAYRLTGVLLHLAATLALYALARRLAGGPAFLFAATWSLHPVLSQAVLYPAQRATVLAGLSFLGTLYFWVLAREGGGLKIVPAALSGACFLLGLGCKEVAALTPPLVFLLDRLLVALPGERGGAPRRVKAALLIGGLVSVAALVLYAGSTNPAAGSVAKDFLADKMYGRGFSGYQRLLSQGRVLVWYVSLILCPFPSRLSIAHSLGSSASLFVPYPTLPALVLASLAVLYALRVFRKRPLAALSILGFFVSLSIEQSVLNLELVFEHRLYVPSLFALILPFAGAVSVLSRKPPRRPRTVVATAAAILLLAGGTARRAAVWRSAEGLWRDAIRKAPASSRPHNNLGRILHERGEWKEALDHYGKALKIDRKNGEAWSNLGSLLLEKGRKDEALAALEEARRLLPEFSDMHYNVGNCLMSLERYDEAEAALREALRLDPENRDAALNLSLVLYATARAGEAIETLESILEKDPDHHRTRYNLSLVLAFSGRWEKAYKEARELERRGAPAELSRMLGRKLEAIRRKGKER